MDTGILHNDVQNFIDRNLNADIRELALKKNPFPEIPMSELLNQIASKSGAKNKLPTWFAARGIVYPPKLSVEQASSEETAAYKASLVGGKVLLDLTGGFGVDSYFFSTRMDQVVHCEVQRELSAIAAHNFRALAVKNIRCVNADSTVFLESAAAADWIYADPARRHDAKGKVFRLRDCTPDLSAHWDLYFSKAPNVLVKTSPMLDISAGLEELPAVREIHVVALKNEVKEILWWLERGFSGTPLVRAVNLPARDRFSFLYGQKSENRYAPAGKYVYEPNAAIMKSGGFHLAGDNTGLAKLSRHAHLYTGEELKTDFPGRIFRLIGEFPYKKESMEKFRGVKANVTVRHFPESVETIRKKWKIADGGDRYLFFTTDSRDQKIVLLCDKIRL